MRRIVVIADLIGDGHDMLTNAKAHRHPVGGTTDADFLMLCRRPGAIRRAHESELRVRRIDEAGLAAVDQVGREAGAQVMTAGKNCFYLPHPTPWPRPDGPYATPPTTGQ